jgi:tRNA-dihydrouridine synthase A
MDDPKLVSELATAMHEGCNGKLPVTVKCRIGTDTNEPFTKDGYAEMDPELEYSRLCQFIETVASNSPVTDFSVHARIAVLRKSFSPADNRKIPPLKYDMVRRLARDYPELTFTLNGGVDTLSQAQDQLNACPELSGVMIGRGFAADPWGFAVADSLLYKEGNAESVTPRNRLQILTEYGKHADAEEENGDPVKIRRFITKAVTTLFTAEPKAKRYRIALDEIGGLPKKLQREGKSLDGQPPLSELILNAAQTHLSEEVLLKTPEESYEEKLHYERKSAIKSGRSTAVVDWQFDRIQQQKEDGQGSYEAALAGSEQSFRS